MQPTQNQALTTPHPLKSHNSLKTNKNPPLLLGAGLITDLSELRLYYFRTRYGFIWHLTAYEIFSGM